MAVLLSFRISSAITVNANLVLESSTLLDMGGTVILHGSLNLQTGLTLSCDVLDMVQELGIGESCTLFAGVSQLSVQQLEPSVTLSAMRNLAGNRGLVLSFNSADGTVNISNTQIVPEPATATLSLLALAALAARRRRK